MRARIFRLPTACTHRIEHECTGSTIYSIAGRRETIHRSNLPTRLQLGTKQCDQLWRDIVRVGTDGKVKGHFLGSVVHIAAEQSSAGISRWLIIDGQQRLTTLTLLLTALRDRLKTTPQIVAQSETLPTSDAINDYYLRNAHAKEERRNKLALRRADQTTLVALLDGVDLPKQQSERIQEKFDFFVDKINDPDINLEIVYGGIKKLMIVDVSLARGQDDPQMIFESLNSTGLDLTQADLIRNLC